MNRRFEDRDVTGHQLGKLGEEQAAVWLDRKGYEIVERNFRCNWGEVDIIAKDGDTLCFIEVKTRRTTDYGLPCQAVSEVKEQHIKRCAYVFMMRYPETYSDIRIDIIEVLIKDGKPMIRQLKNGRDA